MSGVYFAFIDIMKFVVSHIASAADASDRLSQFDVPVIATSQLIVKPRLKGELVVGVVDSKTGETNWLTPQGVPVEPLTSEEAVSVVRDKTDIAADVTEWVTTASQAAEYRGRQLPLWRAYDVDEPSLRVYVDPRSGDIVAIRNTAWQYGFFFGCSTSWITTIEMILVLGY